MGKQKSLSEELSIKSGVLTERMDVGTKDFEDFQFFILSKSRSRTRDQKILVELTALKYRMEKYLEEEQSNAIGVGAFLKSILESIGIRQNRFAEYIGIRPTNFNKIIRGERKLSLEQAVIVGNIFEMDPALFIGIQTKNDLVKISKARKRNYSKYHLKELLEK